MATRLYFHSAPSIVPGSFPNTEQSAITATQIATDANILRKMNPFIGALVTSLSVNSSAVTTAQDHFMGFFCSLPLKDAQIVGGGPMILNAAETESNNAMNWWINSLNIYVWRPSTGSKVGVIRDAAGSSLGGTEPGTSNSRQVTHITGITSSAVSAAAGDVIICEVWVRSTQSGSMTYTGSFFFDGTTETTTENTVVTSHASFIELTENLVFDTRRPYNFAALV